jgi:hypothetical protein
MKLMKNNKQVGGLQTFILGIVSVAVVLAVGLIVLAELQAVADDGVAGATVAGNATGDIITKLTTVPTWIGIIIVVALAFIVLGFFYTKQ